MNDDLIARWVRPAVRALHAYHVPDSIGFIKLDAMENPYAWSDELLNLWLDELRQVSVNRYPHPDAPTLKQQLRLTMGIPADAELVLGNGSDELIQMVAMALAEPGRTVLAPEPTFVMYGMITRFTAMNYVGVPLRSDFDLDMPAMLAAIEEHQPAIVFLSYPNNPTGNLFDRQAVCQIIERSPGLVVVDEAYHAFADDSFMSEVTRYPNLIVMRTVSKMGLAGLRLGFMVGAASWMNEFNKVRLPYNINVLTQVSADFALRHQDVFNRQTEQICRDRGRLLKDLAECKGVTPYPSSANFVLFRTLSGQATAIFESLKAQGVLIKNLSKNGGFLTDCLRVTVGAPDENAAFMVALRRALQN